MLKNKINSLRSKIRSLGSAVVAFSGGVDSAVLAYLAHQELKDKMLAATSDSASVPSRDLSSAKLFCKNRNIPHLIVNTDEFKSEAYALNPDNRCFYCKSALFESLHAVMNEKGFKFIVEGTNASEVKGHRPGFKASCDNPNVATPYADLNITKDEVRAIARSLGLELAEKPSTACLSSRVPTGTKLDPKLLKMIDEAENFLIDLGLKQVRVRHNGDIARIEADEYGMAICINNHSKIAAKLSKLGWKNVALD
ncbi:MAG: ATP-dependent sacrificial sulfur transferase LarE, partial [Deltaproteobacteria bacterium]|nr:ATP-dependent sacrificial sulfur transferase LarE [Deltaproteobacteria bacterium]